MRSWVILGAVILVLLLGLGVFGFYQSIETPKEEQKEAVASFVLEDEDAGTFDDFHLFFGMETIYVATVTETDGEQYYWFYDDEYEQLGRAPLDDVTDEETVIDEARNELGEIDVRDIRIGYEEEEIVYELVYTGADGSLYYDYYTAEEGESFKRYRLPGNDEA
ncbi:hypothetical protein EPH95_01350 [Salicibibacter halophilus]|uniref:DUF5590 domain-containing protein n=1 Tax=Salicibibacter halophilus TaxID=2502791 RepID=A0A514LDQ2_9BACI|nr:hypothetical protein [Salicibibacter halophilus]QDI89982.1 hypothetical protein EPH95_01350 [Salicibibacter halophilus]